LEYAGPADRVQRLRDRFVRVYGLFNQGQLNAAVAAIGVANQAPLLKTLYESLCRVGRLTMATYSSDQTWDPILSSQALTLSLLTKGQRQMVRLDWNTNDFSQDPNLSYTFGLVAAYVYSKVQFSRGAEVLLEQLDEATVAKLSELGADRGLELGAGRVLAVCLALTYAKAYQMQFYEQWRIQHPEMKNTKLESERETYADDPRELLIKEMTRHFDLDFRAGAILALELPSNWGLPTPEPLQRSLWGAPALNAVPQQSTTSNLFQ